MVKKYPVEFEGKTVCVTVPEDDEPTTWAGGGNGPVLPEDKPKK
jgi:hypothetical protein